jgi:GTPase SAR1 family protein
MSITASTGSMKSRRVYVDDTTSRGSGESTQKNQKLVDEILTGELQTEEDLEKEKIKLLILGAGGCGKSTIFKQMKMLYGVQFSERQRESVIPTIHQNIILFMKRICDAVISFELMDTLESKIEFEKIRCKSEDDVMDLESATHIRILWNDPAVQIVWNRRNELQLSESTQYYFNKLEQIADPCYIPSQEDMLYTRVITKGITTEKYVIDGTPFEIYDVGGQRAERRKWIHCFEGVTAIIFVASLADFDLKLYEDESVNRMVINVIMYYVFLLNLFPSSYFNCQVESINLFEEICNNKYFVKSSIILFLNKVDLFEEKLKRISIKSIPDFSDYTGKECDVKDGVSYFKNKFLEKNNNPESKSIYAHETCATDTENIKVVFKACTEIILIANVTEEWKY